MECIINSDTDNELICQGYKRTWWKSALSAFGVIFSCGFLLLIFYWRPEWKLKCTASRTELKEATSVYLKATDETKQVFVSEIKKMPLELANLLTKNKPATQHDFNYDTLSGAFVCYFVHQLAKYIWNFEKQTFVEHGGLDGQVTIGEIHQGSQVGLSENQSENRRKLFGFNLITVKVPSRVQLLIVEILNPFYVFQLFAVIFWMVDEYYIYATAILIMSIISAIASLIEIRKQRVLLHNMVEYHNETKTEILRETSDPVEIWSKELVPGDVIVIPPAGIQLACDAVLVSGTCIVNESMLTGESIPVTKSRLPIGEREIQQVYDIELHKRHTLFSGTQVLQTRNYGGDQVRAVVVRTGYHTAKGQLVHSILFPKPVDMKLLRDAYRFVAILFLMALCGFIYTVIVQSLAGVSAEDIAFNAIDLITISVPPALPLAMSIGIVYAQRRLKRRNIHCISPQRINISGQVDVVAFDKTGTLTEEGLDLHLIIPVNHKLHSTTSQDPKFRNAVQPDQIVEELSIRSELLHCIVTCHTLTIIEGQLTGDPLDIKMFESTGWRLLEPSVDDRSKFENLAMTYVSPSEQFLQNASKHEETRLTESEATQVSQADNKVSSNSCDVTSPFDIGIVCQFPFSSSLQRASVIVKPQQSKPNEMMVYMKGAPETVIKLCRPESVPSDFHEVLKNYSQQGLRMIGAAFKPFSSNWHKAQKAERQSVESDLVFLGLIALENKLKPQSKDALKTLKEANIRSLMVTGDNFLTALSVARESGIIEPHDAVLLASTTPSTPSKPATLMWSVVEKIPIGRVSPMNAIPSRNDQTLKTYGTTQIIMGEQESQSWHLAVSGPSYNVIKDDFPEWMETLAAKGAVFARMSPSQKTSLMEELQEVEYHVCMCGDGANDCGALKRAHSGISLSEYEASVAAPFTSHTDLGIKCVPALIREGRAALTTSYGMFKFMALYSIIQFCSITILYSKFSNLSDLQYLYIDLIIIDVAALTMSRNHAYKYLDKSRPPSSLVSIEILTSLIVQIILQLFTQLLVFFFVQSQCWYTSLPPMQAINNTVGDNATCPQLDHVTDQSQVDNEDNLLTYETTAVFFLSCFLYISVSFAFSRGRPFRTPIYKNRLFLFFTAVLLLFTLFLIFLSPIEVDNTMQIRQIPDPVFLAILVSVAAVHCLVAVAFEMLIIEQPRVWSTMRRFCRCFLRHHLSKRYKVILGGLNSSGFEPNHVLSAGGAIRHPLEVIDKLLYSNVNNNISTSSMTRL